jgi:hypothetical protein
MAHWMPPLGEWNAFGSGSPCVNCFQGPATRRVPSQCQIRAFVPPLGQQRASPGRKIDTFSRMSDPAAVSTAAWWRFIRNCHAPPSERKTTQSIIPVLPGPKRDTTIVWLPGPVKAPQSTLKTGLVTSGSLKPSRFTSSSAAPAEHSELISPWTAGTGPSLAAEEIGLEAVSAITKTAATNKLKREQEVRVRSRRRSISCSLSVGTEGTASLCTRTRAETGDCSTATARI